MITSLLQGGLGNYMFQIAAAAALAAENGDIAVFDLKLNPRPSTGSGHRCEKYITNLFSRVDFREDITPRTIYSEPSFNYKKIPYMKDICLKGYFQSEKYFKNYEKLIKELFSPEKSVETYLQNKYSHILGLKTTSLHVRRGDYLNLKHIHPTCDVEYYQKALKMIEDVEQVLIFSDDIKWCKKNLNIQNCKSEFIENEPDFIDLSLMTMCDHNIISNSSFSWWGAWLNKKTDKKVIAPTKWFGPSGPEPWEDVYCDGWEKI